jgi:aminopeptidase N
VRYALELTLRPEAPTYPGTVSIDVEVREPVRQVWLHAQDVEVSAARVEFAGRTLEARPVTASEGRLGLLLPEALPPGQARLVLAFTGRVEREKSQGLYGETEAGEPYLYTFFEPIDARRAFPCFDEPAFKVPWQLTFTVKQEHVAAANAPVEREEALPGGLKRVTFASSKPMPSYLVAFIVGPFDVVDAGKAGREGVALRFFVPRGRGAEAAYAASVTPRIVSVLEDYFDQPYPFEKLDVAVVPRYWGTMEHPGLVALGQPLTLIRPEDDTLGRRQRYATIAGHELGHYWFGDVVTHRWWDDIWLNESLTSWLDRKVMTGFEPKWGLAAEFSAGALSSAMATDSLVSTLPVRKPVASHDDISGVFDNSTTYAKGSSLLGMLDAWLGEDVTRAVMRAHVRKHAWGTVTSEDFLGVLGAEAGAEAAEVFRGFVDQPGVPRITAELQCRPGAPARLRLAQERYLPLGSKGQTEPLWKVPVCVRTEAGAKACTVLREATGELELPGGSCPRWVLLNADGAGYYRSGYSRPQLDAVLAAPRNVLTEAERLALLSDVGAGVQRGDVLLGEALRAVPSTATDPSRLVVMRGLQLLGAIRTDRLSAEERARYAAWVRTVYAPRARALGWTPRAGESEDEQKLRLVLPAVASVDGEDPTLEREARRLAHAWLKDRKAVKADVAQVALHVAARKGDASLFDAVLAEARRTQDRRERGELLLALGFFTEPALSQRALALVAGSEFDVRETQGILRVALSRPETRGGAWAFYREHFDGFAARLRTDELGRLIEQVGVLCDATQRAEAEALLGPRVKQVEGGPRALARALESIQLCVEADARHGPSVRELLRTQAGGTRARTPAKDR